MGFKLKFKEEAPPPVAAPPPLAVTAQQVLDASQTPMQLRIARIEGEIGEKVTVENRRVAEIAAAIKDGVIVKVHVSRWRAKSKLTAGEVGLKQMTTELERRLQLGHKRLLPSDYDKALENCEVRARQALRTAGIETAYGYFIPAKRFKMFRDVFEAMKTTFWTTLQQIADNIEAIRGAAKSEFAGLAPHVWKNGARDEWSGGQYKTWEAPPQQYVDEFVSRIVAQIPAGAEILDGADFSYRLHVLQAPEVDAMGSFATGDAALHNELMAHAIAQKKSHIDEFFKATRAAMFEQINTLIDEVRGVTEKREHVHKSTLSKILATCANLHDLNVTNDEEVGRLIEEMRGYVQVEVDKGQKVSSEALRVKLSDAAARVVELAKSDLRTTNRFTNV